MANMFVERGRERQKLIAANREQRNAQRQEQMAARRDVANNAYLTRQQARNATQAGADPQYVARASQGAMMYGETIGANADRRQGYMNQQSARNMMGSQGYALERGADAQYLTSQATMKDVEQRPGMLNSELASRERIAAGGYKNNLDVTIAQGEYGKTNAQIQADTQRQQNLIAARLGMMQFNQPLVTESGLIDRDPRTGQLSRDEDGNLIMDSFGMSALDQAEAEYQRASALGKLWKDPLRAVVPFYDPKINAR